MAVSCQLRSCQHGAAASELKTTELRSGDGKFVLRAHRLPPLLAHITWALRAIGTKHELCRGSMPKWSSCADVVRRGRRGRVGAAQAQADVGRVSDSQPAGAAPTRQDCAEDLSISAGQTTSHPSRPPHPPPPSLLSSAPFSAVDAMFSRALRTKATAPLRRVYAAPLAARRSVTTDAASSHADREAVPSVSRPLPMS